MDKNQPTVVVEERSTDTDDTVCTSPKAIVYRDLSPFVPCRTRLLTELTGRHNQQSVAWIDKRGNVLHRLYTRSTPEDNTHIHPENAYTLSVHSSHLPIFKASHSMKPQQPNPDHHTHVPRHAATSSSARCVAPMTLPTPFEMGVPRARTCRAPAGTKNESAVAITRAMPARVVFTDKRILLLVKRIVLLTLQQHT